MFKRVTWFGVGFVVGGAASKWAEVKARRLLARYFPAGRLSLPPSAEVVDLAERARGLAANKMSNKMSDLRGAVEGGRSAMTAKEAELRRQLRLVGPDENPRVG